MHVGDTFPSDFHFPAHNVRLFNEEKNILSLVPLLPQRTHSFGYREGSQMPIGCLTDGFGWVLGLERVPRGPEEKGKMKDYFIV